MVNPCFTYLHKTQCKTTRHGTDITELRSQTIRGRLAVARRRLVRARETEKLEPSRKGESRLANSAKERGERTLLCCQATASKRLWRRNYQLTKAKVYSRTISQQCWQLNESALSIPNREKRILSQLNFILHIYLVRVKIIKTSNTIRHSTNSRTIYQPFQSYVYTEKRIKSKTQLVYLSKGRNCLVKILSQFQGFVKQLGYFKIIF